PTGVTLQTLSRPFLERHIRKRVLGLDNVTLTSGFRVEGVLTSPGTPSAVIGVHGHRDGKLTNIEAELTIDSTGRLSQSSRWMRIDGGPSIAEKVVDANVTYTTRIYEGHPEGGLRVYGTYPFAPTQPRGAGIIAIEKGLTMVALMGVDGESTPSD